MFFWSVAASLVFAACLAVIWPFLRRRSGAGPDAAHDIEVYTDQLAEVDRDRERGLIGEPEAEQAKAEIGRRIIRIAEAERRATRVSRLTPIVATLALVAVPAVSLTLYAALGSPGLPAQPLQARLEKNPNESSLEELILRAERHLAANPSDARGWAVVAPIYLRIGRSADSVIAYENAIRLSEPSAALQAGLGEALATRSQGLVTEEAMAAFEEALRRDPDNPKARYFVATALAQEGRAADAVAEWRRMADDLPAASPWRGAAERAIAQAAQPAAPDAPGPDESDMSAAAAMTPEDRQAMIEGMVSGLDQRLRENPEDPEGWVRLVRSYLVLGRQAEARSALERGLEALDGSDGAGRLRAFAETAGIATTE